MAASGQADQALAILDGDAGAYRASYALAPRRHTDSDWVVTRKRVWPTSMALAESGQVGANLASVRQKLQSLAAAEVTASPEAGAQPGASDAQGQ